MLEKTKEYLRGEYPYAGSDLYMGVVAELTQAINDSSISVITKHIRECGLPCPLIVKTVDTGEYTFHKCARKVLLDFEETYVTKIGYSYGFGGFSRTSDYVGDVAIMVSADHPRYVASDGDSYPLYLWILHGNICDECGAIHLDFDGEGLCSVCSQQYTLLEYTAKAENILETEDTKETLFGVELEYEGITAKQVAKCLKGHAISKRDGSIHNGAEIVTRPACVATHKKSLQPFYESVKVAAKSNTGMHVHVDRSKLSNYEIGFMMEFLNKTELIPHIEEVAGRKYSGNSYCKASPGMKMSWGNKFDEGSYKVHKQATQKYSPLNTSKSKTVEFRIFSSPESHEEVCAKLDFVAALVKYSSPYAVSVKSLKDKFEWGVFTDFVKMNKKTYPHFCSFFLKG